MNDSFMEKIDISSWTEYDMEEFIKVNSSTFHAFASRYVDDTETIDDFLQEAYIKLWTHRKTIGKVSSPRNYFFTILRNTILDKWMYQKHKFEDIEQENFLNISSNDSFVQYIIEAESSRLIVEAIGKLSPQSQRVIQMTLDGHSLQEIAETLKVTINTVKTVKHRALHRLSTLLDKEDFLSLLFLFIF